MCHDKNLDNYINNFLDKNLGIHHDKNFDKHAYSHKDKNHCKNLRKCIRLHFLPPSRGLVPKPIPLLPR